MPEAANGSPACCARDPMVERVTANVMNRYLGKK